MSYNYSRFPSMEDQMNRPFGSPYMEKDEGIVKFKYRRLHMIPLCTSPSTPCSHRKINGSKRNPVNLCYWVLKGDKCSLVGWKGLKGKGRVDMMFGKMKGKMNRKN